MNDYELRDLAARSRESMNSRERAIWELGNRGRQDLLLELLKGYTAGDDVLISDTLRQLQGSSDQKVYNILSELHRRTTEEGNVIHGETNAEILDAMKRFRMEQ